MPQLIKQLDGMTLTVLGRELWPSTAAAEIVEYRPDWRTRLLVVGRTHSR